MMTSIQSAAPVAIRPYSAAAPPAPKSEPQVADSLDLSTIDTPAKAASLPCLNPAMLGILVAGMVVSAMTNAPATAVVSLALGDQQGNLTYTFNPQNPQKAVTVSGELGGQAYSETWAVDQEKKQVSVSGRLGETAIDLKMNAGEKAMLVKGSIGELGLTQVIGGEGDMSAVTSSGKLGSETFNTDVRISEDEDRNYLMAVSGNLGQQALEQSVKIGKGEDSQLAFQGQGNLAGTSFSMEGKLFAAER